MLFLLLSLGCVTSPLHFANELVYTPHNYVDILLKSDESDLLADPHMCAVHISEFIDSLHQENHSFPLHRSSPRQRIVDLIPERIYEITLQCEDVFVQVDPCMAFRIYAQVPALRHYAPLVHGGQIALFDSDKFPLTLTFTLRQTSPSVVEEDVQGLDTKSIDDSTFQTTFALPFGTDVNQKFYRWITTRYRFIVFALVVGQQLCLLGALSNLISVCVVLSIQSKRL
uniref:Transmembrane 9 superfamily member n=1 Tax=Spongospora subterranea TaxID=70186 RepID=A0A0H5RKC5_9EUKA|eukprot:CRZ09184.1 hypothetical protein [Spongospora subterranea]